MSAVSALVLRKNLLDQALPPFTRVERFMKNWSFNSGRLRAGWDQRDDNASVLIDADIFCRATLPFIDPHGAAEPAIFRWVDPYRVLGGLYRGYHTPKNVNAACDYFDQQSKSGDAEAARYIELAPFGFYLPFEGKNRVSLYRSLARPIGALVRTVHYPPPTDFELVRLTPFEQVGLRYRGANPRMVSQLRHWQAVRDDPPMAILGFPESVPLLQALGVQHADASVFEPFAPLIAAGVRVYAAHHYYRA